MLTKKSLRTAMLVLGVTIAPALALALDTNVASAGDYAMSWLPGTDGEMQLICNPGGNDECPQ